MRFDKYSDEDDANREMANELDRLADMLAAGANALRNINKVRRERDEWEEKHNKVVMESINHSREMTGQLLSAAINGAVGMPKEVK